MAGLVVEIRGQLRSDAAQRATAEQPVAPYSPAEVLSLWSFQIGALPRSRCQVVIAIFALTRRQELELRPETGIVHTSIF
jgi:hypothetical protein